MVTYAEHRAYSRSPIHARTEVRLGNGITVEGRAVDVSLHGLMFVTENRLPIGKPVRVMLILEENVEPRRINVGGQIARLFDDGVAVQFTEMDLDNTRTLGEVILINTPPRDRGIAPLGAPMVARKN